MIGLNFHVSPHTHTHTHTHRNTHIQTHTQTHTHNTQPQSLRNRQTDGMIGLHIHVSPNNILSVHRHSHHCPGCRFILCVDWSASHDNLLPRPLIHKGWCNGFVRFSRLVYAEQWRRLWSSSTFQAIKVCIGILCIIFGKLGRTKTCHLNLYLISVTIGSFLWSSSTLIRFFPLFRPKSFGPKFLT